ncbi:MAG: winged helix-turn-helix domain-containing protein [Planctomycetota bacterium]
MKKNDVEIGATFVAKVSGKLARVRIERESPHGGWEAKNVDTGRRVRIKSAHRLRRAVGDPKRFKAIAAADQENARLRDEREPSPDGMAASERAMAESTAATAPATAIAESADGSADALDPDVCATVGCGRPAALTYLGRPRCQACYEDDVADGDETSEPLNHEEIDMAKAKKTTKKSAAKTTRAPKASKQPKAPKPKAATPAGDAKPKRVSALDAAAQVLARAGKPMRAQELIAAMAEQGLWTSPGGKTPHATLYAAILREIGAKGDQARFRKTDRGQFEYAG